MHAFTIDSWRVRLLGRLPLSFSSCGLEQLMDWNSYLGSRLGLVVPKKKHYGETGHRLSTHQLSMVDLRAKPIEYLESAGSCGCFSLLLND